MKNNLDFIIETVRKFTSSFGAFQLVFEDGSIQNCKTPTECSIGMYTLQYWKKHPEEAKKILEVKLPEEDGTFYWMKEAYGRVI